MIVLIPALEPDDRLLGLLAGLRAYGVRAVVVDDGSGPGFDQVFAAARRLGATVLRTPVNHGKGHALKLGLAHVAATWPGQDVVCADSDGQHTVSDVLAVGERVRASRAVVLGARAFTGAVPRRSRAGNTAARLAFALATGLAVPDTQTGLRGYPADRLAWALAVPGERFEYEQRLLLAAARDGVPMVSEPIATVYVDGNRSSHFRPVLDSLRVMAPVLRYVASSFLGFVVDTVVLLVLARATGSLLASVLAARLVSGSVNFAVNRRWVFRHGGHPWRKAATSYATLAAVLLAANFGLMSALTGIGVPLLAAKLLTEAMLVGAGFVLQRQVVFAGPSGVGSRSGAQAGAPTVAEPAEVARLSRP